MMLRKSISNTKNFFRKTFDSFKSLFFGGYERLPKSSPLNTNYVELDKFYNEFTDRWDSEKEHFKKRNKKITPTSKQEKEAISNGGYTKVEKASSMEVPRKSDDDHKRKTIASNKKREKPSSQARGVMREERRACLVAKKLKELEMLDINNVDHVLDIEEVLHYYSRLTCPAYVDIVDKFFLDMYEDLSRSRGISLHC